MILINVVILIIGGVFDALFGWSAKTPYDHSREKEDDKK